MRTKKLLIFSATWLLLFFIPILSSAAQNQELVETVQLEGSLKDLTSKGGKLQIEIDNQWYSVQSNTKYTLCGEMKNVDMLAEYDGANVNITLPNAESTTITQIDVLCD